MTHFNAFPNLRTGYLYYPLGIIKSLHTTEPKEWLNKYADNGWSIRQLQVAITESISPEVKTTRMDRAERFYCF